MKTLDDFLGVLREIFHQKPNEERWAALCELWVKGWRTHRASRDVWIAYAAQHLETWPDEQRIFRGKILNLVLKDADELVSLARGAEVDRVPKLKKLWKRYPSLPVVGLDLRQGPKQSTKALCKVFADERLAGLRELLLPPHYLEWSVSDAMFASGCGTELRRLVARETFLSPHRLLQWEEAGGLGKLRSLVLDNNRLDGRETQNFSKLQCLRNLETLSLAGTVLGDGGLRALASISMPELTWLSLSQNWLTDQAVADWCRALQGRSLGYLDLSGNALRGGVGKALGSCAHLGSLYHLNLSGNDLTPQDLADLAGSSHLSRLRALNVASNYFGSEGACAFAEALSAVENVSYVWLDLCGNQIDDEGTVALAHTKVLARATDLQGLFLDGNLIASQGAQALADAFAQSPDNKRGLRTLKLAGNCLGKEGIDAIAKAVWPCLETLSLGGNAATFADLGPLLEPEHFPALRTLDVSYNTFDISQCRTLVKKARKSQVLLVAGLLRHELFGAEEERRLWALLASIRDDPRGSQTAVEALSNEALLQLHFFCRERDTVLPYYYGYPKENRVFFEHIAPGTSEDGAEDLASAHMGRGYRDFVRGLATPYAFLRSSDDVPTGHFSPLMDLMSAIYERDLAPLV